MLPDLEADAMQPDRLRSHARWEVHGVRRLRRGNTLTTSIAQTASRIFTQSASQGTVRQSSLAQARPDGERHRTMVHEVLLAAPPAAHQAAAVSLRLPDEACNVHDRAEVAPRLASWGIHGFRASRNPALQLELVNGVLTGKCSSAVGKPVICAWLVTFRLVCLGRDAFAALPSGQSLILVSLTNQESDLPVKFMSTLSVTKLYVGSLAFTASDEAVHALFSKHGTLEKVSVLIERDTGRPRRFGFLEMSNADAPRAMQALNGTEFDGRSLKVSEAQDRGRSGGGNRDGPRSY
jgi:hypothetical protein